MPVCTGYARTGWLNARCKRCGERNEAACRSRVAREQQLRNLRSKLQAIALARQVPTSGAGFEFFAGCFVTAIACKDSGQISPSQADTNQTITMAVAQGEGSQAWGRVCQLQTGTFVGSRFTAAFEALAAVVSSAGSAPSENGAAQPSSAPGGAAAAPVLVSN